MQLCGFNVGLDQRFFLIAGTCSIEGLEMSLDVAGQLKEACAPLGIPLIYKGSFDKANRSSGTSKRGVGLEAGLKILDEVRRQLQLPILTDVHDTSHVAEVASVVDVLQTPAFLCRQTDFIRAVAQSGKPVAMIYADKERPGAIEISEQELALLRTLRNQAVLAIKQAG